MPISIKIAFMSDWINLYEGRPNDIIKFYWIILILTLL